MNMTINMYMLPLISPVPFRAGHAPKDARRLMIDEFPPSSLVTLLISLKSSDYRDLPTPSTQHRVPGAGLSGHSDLVELPLPTLVTRRSKCGSV